MERPVVTITMPAPMSGVKETIARGQHFRRKRYPDPLYILAYAGPDNCSSTLSLTDIFDGCRIGVSDMTTKVKDSSNVSDEEWQSLTANDPDDYYRVDIVRC